MARSRNLKPAFFTNDELAQCDYGARLLFAGLWTIADREGRLEDRPARIKAMLFPFDRCNVDRWLGALADRGFIIRYEVDGVGYIQIPNFLKHQTPHQKEPASLIPEPDLSKASLSLVSPATYIGRGKQEEGNGRGNQSAGAQWFEPPTVEQVAAYCAERSSSVDAEAFVAYYASNGWKVGKNAMKDWRMAVITWERNGYGGRTKQAPRPRAISGISDENG